MSVLLAVLLLLAAAAGTGVVLARDPRRQVLAIALNGLVLSLLFMALPAPDVAYSELAVGTAALPVLFLAALASIRPAYALEASALEEQEKADRPLWLMLLPIGVLLAVVLVGGSYPKPLAEHAVQQFMHPDADAILGLGGGLQNPRVVPIPPASVPLFVPWLGVGLALLVAGYDLGRHRLPKPLVKAVAAAADPIFIVLDRVHSGLIGDYVAWIMLGLAFFAAAFFFAG